jgi:hypothetical protein
MVSRYAQGFSFRHRRILRSPRFLDYVSDTNRGDESSVDAAIGQVAVAHKRLHDVIDALDDSRNEGAFDFDPKGNVERRY